ncbi:MAG: S8 family peptidase [Candidatus Nanopelagicaceae bacterium]|nr:S8 family peptidase [Candidatus Nanopelagicaceae bacterium]
MRRLIGLPLGLLSIALLPLSIAPSFATPEFATYIVVLQPGTDHASAAREFRGAGWRIQYDYTNVFSGFAISLPVSAVLGLEHNPKVLYVERDEEMTASDIQAPAPSWGLDRIDQRERPLSNTFEYSSLGQGAGVRAYIVDTGIRSTHADFAGRIAPGFSSVIDPVNTTEDCNGHGTHVSGTLAGTTYGVAKAATIVPVRVLDCQGSGSTATVVAGLDWVAADHTSGPAVVNMSLGGRSSRAVDAAVVGVFEDGITVVVAAGNAHTNACTASPGRVEQAITVGATNATDTRAPYSNFGKCVDLFAPGSYIVSDWITSTTATSTLSGTSMSTPHVAGVAALLLSRTPTLTPSGVALALASSATIGVIADVGARSPNLLVYSDPLGG